MAIAARLHAEPGRGRLCQIECHQGGGAAQERERRLAHPSVTNREQRGDSSGVGFNQQLDRVGAIRGRRPRRVILARHLLAQPRGRLSGAQRQRHDRT